MELPQPIEKPEIKYTEVSNVVLFQVNFYKI